MRLAAPQTVHGGSSALLAPVFVAPDRQTCDQRAAVRR
jgi:hypothetical protein